MVTVQKILGTKRGFAKETTRIYRYSRTEERTENYMEKGDEPSHLVLEKFIITPKICTSLCESQARSKQANALNKKLKTVC